jgi:hypothetical protein
MRNTDTRKRAEKDLRAKAHLAIVHLVHNSVEQVAYRKSYKGTLSTQ